MLDFEELETVWAQTSDKLLLILRPLGGPLEDAIQEAFIALADQPRLSDCPLAWLVTVARNRLLQWQRGNVDVQAVRCKSLKTGLYAHPPIVNGIHPTYRLPLAVYPARKRRLSPCTFGER